MSAYAGLAQGIRDRTKMAYEDSARAQEIQARKDMFDMQNNAENVRAGAEAFDKFMANISNPEAYRLATQQLHFDQSKPWAWRDEGIPKLTAMLVTLKPARTETRATVNPVDNSLDAMKSPSSNAPVLPTETVPSQPSYLPMLKSAYGVQDNGVPADLYGGINPSAASQGAETALRQAFDSGQVQKALGVDQPQQVPIVDPERTTETIDIPAVTKPAFDTTTLQQAALDYKGRSLDNLGAYRQGMLDSKGDRLGLDERKAIGKGEIDPNAPGSVGPAAASRFAVDQAKIADYTTKANQRVKQLELEWFKAKDTAGYRKGQLGVAQQNADTARQNAGTNAGRLGETTAYHNFLRTKAAEDAKHDMESLGLRKEELVAKYTGIAANAKYEDDVTYARDRVARLTADEEAPQSPLQVYAEGALSFLFGGGSKTGGARPNATTVGGKPAATGAPAKIKADVAAMRKQYGASATPALMQQALARTYGGKPQDYVGVTTGAK